MAHYQYPVIALPMVPDQCAEEVLKPCRYALDGFRFGREEGLVVIVRKYLSLQAAEVTLSDAMVEEGWDRSQGSTDKAECVYGSTQITTVASIEILPT